MNCPKCNKSVPANARFCGSCGQPDRGGSGRLRSAAAATPAMAGATAAASSTASGAAAATSKAWAAAAASAPGLLARVKNIVLAPRSEWPVIAPEPTTIAQLYAGYVMPLAVLAALLGFVRMSVLGVNTAFGGGFRMPIASGLTYTVMMFVSALIGVFIVGFIINALAPTFSGQRDQRQALKVAAYSLTPAMLSSVLALSPILPTLLQLLRRPVRHLRAVSRIAGGHAVAQGKSLRLHRERGDLHHSGRHRVRRAEQRRAYRRQPDGASRQHSALSARRNRRPRGIRAPPRWATPSAISWARTPRARRA